MPKYTVKFPLEATSATSTFEELGEDNIEEVVRFNLKSTILTCPGERRSDPEFGACARKSLFELTSNGLESLRSRILTQVLEHVPYCRIEELTVTTPEDNPNAIHIRLKYLVAQINKKDVFELILSA